MKKQLQIVCFGEVLFDVFPSHEKIGGAPLNVALRLQSFNNTVYMISGIGTDEKGADALEYMTIRGLDTSLIQQQDNYKTGLVYVSLDADGVASYDIASPCAWDFIAFHPEQLDVVNTADAFVFGSLIARHEVSKHTLFQILKTTTFKVFDVNLRQPFITKSVLVALMQAADFIKLNDEELYVISDFLESKYKGVEQNIQWLAKLTQTKHICVTKGKFGAVLWYNNAFYYNSGFRAQVNDTVGAGDSFLATLIHKLLVGEHPQQAINYACAVGAMVAEKAGANPELSEKQIENFINPL